MKINNLVHLKRMLHDDAEFRVIRYQKHPETIGLISRVRKVKTNVDYTVNKYDPDNINSKCNSGLGLRFTNLKY